jgi:hypothetical protein
MMGVLVPGSGDGCTRGYCPNLIGRDAQRHMTAARTVATLHAWTGTTVPR